MLAHLRNPGDPDSNSYNEFGQVFIKGELFSNLYNNIGYIQNEEEKQVLQQRFAMAENVIERLRQVGVYQHSSTVM